MHRRRWLIVAVCFCAFTGCVACQSSYDYCGPMPDEGGDFMYRKNSVLGGDPSMPLADDQATSGEAGEATDESGLEPTPAPPPDEESQGEMDMDGTASDLDSDADSEDEGEADDEPLPQAADEEDEGGEDSVSTLQWHAPVKGGPSPVKQVRFRGE